MELLQFFDHGDMHSESHLLEPSDIMAETPISWPIFVIPEVSSTNCVFLNYGVL